MSDQLKGFKEKSERTGIPESSLYVMKIMENKLDAAMNYLRTHLEKKTSTWLNSCNHHTTIGGAAIEEISAPKVKAGMHVFASIETKGANPVSLLSSRCENGKIVLEFSGDPGSDHVLSVMVVQCQW